VSVGLPDAAVKESPSTKLRVFDKDRVHTAYHQLGIQDAQGPIDR